MDPQCNVCGRTENLKRCAGCQTILYCSKEHQKQDWRSHKTLCKSLKEKPAHLRKGCQLDQTTNELFKNEKFDQRPLKKYNCLARPRSVQPEVLAQFVGQELLAKGLCVVDGVFGKSESDSILEEVQSQYESGKFIEGQLSGGQTSAESDQKYSEATIRGDKIMWNETSANVSRLVGKMDDMFLRLNKYLKGIYNVSSRTKAMIACYPANGTGYIRHVDNPNRDGRCITCIYYLNKNWKVEEHGGLLRVFPELCDDEYVDIEPLMDRMLFFWSDRRNPHEVQPAFKTRYAITVWYFDKDERERAKQKGTFGGNKSFIQEETSLLELDKKIAEKKELEKKIEDETKKAIDLLSSDELEAMIALIQGHPHPSSLLADMGVAPSLQEALITLANQSSPTKTTN